MSGDPPAMTWVRPEIVVEVQYTAWSGAGRVRHAVYLGTRDDKLARDVVRAVADPEAERVALPQDGRTLGGRTQGSTRKGWHGAIPPLRRSTLPSQALPPPPPPPSALPPPPRRSLASGSIVVAHAPKKAVIAIGGVELSHADRPLWPGVTKQDLAEYWQAVADVALPGLARRPLAILRCPEGIGGKAACRRAAAAAGGSADARSYAALRSLARSCISCTAAARSSASGPGSRRAKTSDSAP